VAVAVNTPSDPLALRRLIEARLEDSRPPVDPGSALPGGLAADLANDSALRAYFPTAPAAAAVLVPIIVHASGLTVLLTQRASHLKHHPGQIAFPGGRLEPSDGGPLQAALRETREEIGLSPELVTVAGYLDSHLVLTGFWVTPVVGFVQPGFALTLDAREVESTFEVPLTHILDAANHRSRERRIGERAVQVYDIPYLDHNIWGATAGMLMSLYRLLTEDVQ
jgi:8-oxo-dGTP pyrophosphatase MutT (NUDIX family)